MVIPGNEQCYCHKLVHYTSSLLLGGVVDILVLAVFGSLLRREH